MLESTALFPCFHGNTFHTCPGLTLIICWCAFCIPRNTSLQSQSIGLCFLHYRRELMHSLVAQGSCSCVGKNYFVSMLPWQHLPHLNYLNLITCWCAFCITRNALLQSLSIVLCFLHFWRELMHSLVAQASYSSVGNNDFFPCIHGYTFHTRLA